MAAPGPRPVHCGHRPTRCAKHDGNDGPTEGERRRTISIENLGVSYLVARGVAVERRPAVLQWSVQAGPVLQSRQGWTAGSPCSLQRDQLCRPPVSCSAAVPACSRSNTLHDTPDLPSQSSIQTHCHLTWTAGLTNENLRLATAWYQDTLSHRPGNDLSRYNITISVVSLILPVIILPHC